MKLVLPLLAALLAMGLLFFAIGDPGSELPTALAAQESQTEKTRPARSGLAQSTHELRLPAQAIQVPERSDAAEMVMPQNLVASGRVVVIEPDGSLNHDLNGDLRISFQPRTDKFRLSRYRSIEVGFVTVTDGRWEIRTSLNDNNTFYSADLETQSFRLESTDAHVDPEKLRDPLLFADCPNETEGPGRLELVDEEHCFSFGDKDVEITLRRRGLFRIEVNAADTGLPLEKVTIFKARRVMRGTWPPARRWRIVAEASPSPIVTDAGFARNLPNHSVRARKRTKGNYVVGSPGYAWQVVHLDFVGGETHQVNLVRGGDLGVTLRGISPPRNAVLRVRSGNPAASPVEIPIKDAKSFGLSGLPLGRQVLTIEVDNRSEPPTVLAETTAHISSGVLTQAVLEVLTPAGTDLAQVAGHLTIPPEWEFEQFTLKLGRLSEHPGRNPAFIRLGSASLNELEEAPGTYAFDFGLVHIGRFVLKVSPPGHSFFFELDNYGQNRNQSE